MINDLRDALLLMATLSIFLMIIAIILVGAVMRPSSRGERYRLVP